MRISDDYLFMTQKTEIYFLTEEDGEVALASSDKEKEKTKVICSVFKSSEPIQFLTILRYKAC